jgi:uncharacterized protein YceK
MISCSRIAAGTILFCLTGCGTLMNMPAPCHGPETPLQLYGGVRTDLQMAKSNLESMSTASVAERNAKVRGCVLLALDVPLSMAADTAILPITLPLSLARLCRQAEITQVESTTPELEVGGLK